MGSEQTVNKDFRRERRGAERPRGERERERGQLAREGERGAEGEKGEKRRTDSRASRLYDEIEKRLGHKLSGEYAEIVRALVESQTGDELYEKDDDGKGDAEGRVD